jgi:hypothetical protein
MHTRVERSVSVPVESGKRREIYRFEEERKGRRKYGDIPRRSSAGRKSDSGGIWRPITRR